MKAFWKSKTLWGALLTVAGMAGLPVDGIKEEILQIIDLVTQIVGLVMVVYGRFKADAPLALTDKPSN